MFAAASFLPWAVPRKKVMIRHRVSGGKKLQMSGQKWFYPFVVCHREGVLKAVHDGVQVTESCKQNDRCFIQYVTLTIAHLQTN